MWRSKLEKSKLCRQLLVLNQICTACLAVIAESKLIQPFNIFALLLAKSVFAEAMRGKNWQLKVLEIKSLGNYHLFKSFGQPETPKPLS